MIYLCKIYTAYTAIAHGNIIKKDSRPIDIEIIGLRKKKEG
jgi:hypothetical protein